MKKALIAIVVVAILAVGGYFFYQESGANLKGDISAKERIKQATDPISASDADYNYANQQKAEKEAKRENYKKSGL